MINKVYSSSSGIHVDPTNTAYIGNNGPLAGQVRFNTNNQEMEVYDGSVWFRINSSISIGLSGEVESIINWARLAMRREKDLEKKLEKYPALREAYDHFKTLEALAHEEE